MTAQTRQLTHHRAVVIGIGNDFRHDDAAGLLVVRQLNDHCNSTCVEIVESDGDVTEIFRAWDNCHLAFLVDAVCSNNDQSIIRIDATKANLPAQLGFSSSHSFGTAEVISLGRSLNQLPDQIIIYGIRGKNFAIGHGLSEGVAEAVQCVAEWITDELAIWETQVETEEFD